MADLRSRIPDLIEFSTVLVAPGVQPASVEPSDLAMLGEANMTEAVRTPVLTVYRFPAHIVVVQDPLVQVTTSQPTMEMIDRVGAAVDRFIDTYAGRKTIKAVGHNLKFRRRLSDGVGPQEFFRRLINHDVFDALPSAKTPEANMELVFFPAWCTQAKMRVEPSRVDDLEAIYFAFNFHFDTSGDGDSHELGSAQQAGQEVVTEAEAVVARFLEEVGREVNRG